MPRCRFRLDPSGLPRQQPVGREATTIRFSAPWPEERVLRQRGHGVVAPDLPCDDDTATLATARPWTASRSAAPDELGRLLDSYARAPVS